MTYFRFLVFFDVYVYWMLPPIGHIMQVYVDKNAEEFLEINKYALLVNLVTSISYI